MGYDVYLGEMLLPVTPGKIDTIINNQNKTITLIDGSEVNVLKRPGLTDVQFTCEVPYYPMVYSKAGSENISPAVFQTELERLKVENEPFQFIVSRAYPDGGSLHHTNLTVTLEDYKILEDASQGWGVLYEIKLKQYRPYGTKEAKLIEPEPDAEDQTPKIDPVTPRPTSPDPGVTIGASVIVNGQLHRDSYGNGPGQTRTDYKGKVNFINEGSSHPYHVTTPDGLWQGWVTKDSVQVAL